MRNSLGLACILVGVSCTTATPSSKNLDYLKCPDSSMTASASGDTGAGSSDSSLFGSFTTNNPNSCIEDSTICDSLGMNFMCDKIAGCCIETNIGRCNVTKDCSSNKLANCDTASHNCLACSTDQQCALWVAARTDPQNETKCISGQCLECRVNTDCTRMGKGKCNQITGICGGCTQNSDCPGSNICKTDPSLLVTGDSDLNVGSCVLAGDVAFVDNTNVACGSGSGAGTQAMPFCEIAAAITGGKSFINVVKGQGSTKLYQPVVVGTSGQRVVIQGPGRDVAYSGQAVINGVTVSGGAQVTLIDIAVANMALQPAVQCSGSSTLYVHRVLIADTTATPRGGIYATNCTKVEVEKTKIYTVNGNGIYITGGSAHRIVNNAIISGSKNNTTPTEQYGMRLSQSADGLFAFNTIAGNLSGVLCDTGATISDSIIVSNGTAMQATQISGCSAMSLRNAVTSVDLNPAYMTGGDPDLIAGTANNGNCCFGKGAADANKTIIDDYHMVTRPSAHGYDVGYMQTQ